MTNPERLRDEAAEHDRAAEESFQRCDTDGFLTQWAHGINADIKRRQAEIEENGGRWTFPGLFDRETGQRVRAKIVHVADRYSYVEGATRPLWLVLGPRDEALLWLPAYRTSKRSKLWQAGFEERDEEAPARAEIQGRGRGLSGTAWVAVVRTDGGYPEDATQWGRTR